MGYNRRFLLGVGMVHTNLSRFLALVVCLVGGGVAAVADTAKEAAPTQWQLGLGVGGQVLPDYRGANQVHAKVLPVPIALYNGRFLKINRDGARGEFFESKRVQLDISADAALNGDSEDNRAREGMPTLDSSFELGPSLNIRLSGPSFSHGWSLRLPVRGVFTVGSGVHHRGTVLNPRLTWRKPKALGQWDANFAVGALWGNEQYHDYYYQIDPLYATATRPVYDAHAGYAGTYSKLGVRRHWGDWLFGIFVRYDNLAGATFEPSPLVKTKHYGALGFGIGKTFLAL